MRNCSASSWSSALRCCGSSGPGVRSASTRVLVADASKSQVRLKVVADQAGIKHTGDARNRGKGGTGVAPVG